jgi:hypothetical protein
MEIFLFFCFSFLAPNFQQKNLKKFAEKVSMHETQKIKKEEKSKEKDVRKMSVEFPTKSK